MAVGKNQGVGQGVGGGRPLAFTSVDKLQKKIDKYFEECKEEKRPYTMSGLAYSLNVSRITLLNYSKKEKFFSTLEKAKQRCEVYTEEQLYRTHGSTNGIKFAMTNNFEKWDDKQTTNHTGETPQFNVNFTSPSDNE